MDITENVKQQIIDAVKRDDLSGMMELINTHGLICGDRDGETLYDYTTRLEIGSNDIKKYLKEISFNIFNYKSKNTPQDPDECNRQENNTNSVYT